MPFFRDRELKIACGIGVREVGQLQKYYQKKLQTLEHILGFSAPLCDQNSLRYRRDQKRIKIETSKKKKKTLFFSKNPFTRTIDSFLKKWTFWFYIFAYLWRIFWIVYKHRIWSITTKLLLSWCSQTIFFFICFVKVLTQQKVNIQ